MSYTDIRDHLKERFAPAHRSLRLRQTLSIRRQGASESIETFLADLNEIFSCLDLRNEDNLSYLFQRLRPDIQAEVLKKEPKTYAEAEDAARLIYSIQQALSQRREEDITRIVQQTNLLSGSSTFAASPNPHRYTDNQKLIEQNVALLGKIEALTDQLGNSSTKKTANIAAFDDQNPDDQRSLLKVVDKMEDRLINLIKDLDRRMDARVNGLARRSQATRSEPARERARDGRPLCFTCGQVGHLQTNCPQRRNSDPRSHSPELQQQQYRLRYSPNSNYNQPRDIYRNVQDPSLAFMDEGLYADEIFGTIQPSSVEGLCYARRSKPPTDKATPHSTVGIQSGKSV